MPSWEIPVLCVILFVGLAVAVDVPFIFDKNLSSISKLTPKQLENMSIQVPEFAGVPPIITASNNAVINISGYKENNTYYRFALDYSSGASGAPSPGIPRNYSAFFPVVSLPPGIGFAESLKSNKTPSNDSEGNASS